MRKFRQKSYPKVSIPLTPMIDIVFLMLIYFLVSASLNKQEADIVFQLPGLLEQSETLDIPDDLIINITSEGNIVVNDFTYDTIKNTRYSKLTQMLIRHKQSCDANKTMTGVTIDPASNVTHQTIIKVMDCCSISEVSNVNFALKDDTN